MGSFKASLILEILGRPPAHIVEALQSLVTRIGAEKGVKVLEKTIHEPRAVEGSKDLFTTFAEVTIEMESLENYFGIVFAYMPAHIELITPERIVLNNFELNELANKILARMHDYDAITKKNINERDFVLDKLREAAPHVFKALTTPPQAQQTQQVQKKPTKQKVKSKASSKKKRR